MGCILMKSTHRPSHASLLLSPPAKYIWMLPYLVSEGLVIAHYNHAVAPLLQSVPYQLITFRLVRVIMHRSVAKYTDIRCVEKVWNAAQFGDRLLRFAWQTMVTGGQGIEEAALKFRAGIGERTQPFMVCSPVAA